MGHQIESVAPLRGAHKLAAMASAAIAECTETLENDAPLPLLLCVAEHDRPGRVFGVETELVDLIEAQLKMRLERARTRVFSAGRIGTFLALAEARGILAQGQTNHVIVAATDSLLVARTLAHLCEQNRVLTEENCNGFMPGEGAGALLIGRARAAGDIVFLGFGEGTETAPVMSEEPLRANGLKVAIRQALVDGGDIPFEAVDVRISDVSGEQYVFKEAALAAGSLLRTRRENQDLWHPAEVVGEVGSAIGPVMIAIAADALHANTLDAPVLLHAGDDGGRRVACVMGVSSKERKHE